MHTPPESGPAANQGSSLVCLSPATSDSPPLPAASIPPDEIPTYIGTRRTPAAEALALAPGYRLGHFEILEAIGSGGMASVLKARDTELGRTVALKILPPEAARDAENVNRFKQEARAAAKLDHENVARVFFCGEDKGLHFIAFEFVEGENLRVWIDRLGQIAPSDALRYMLHLAAGLQHAAERGVVHRDIKPSNIIITPDGRAKIIDMGLARHHESQSVNGGVTHSGVTLGTFDYISPEQALDPRRADVRSDIYSLGCTFYHALTGRVPVPEGTAAAKLQAQQHHAPLDPRLINPQISDDLAAVLSRMMAKNPARRYQSPTELIADLQALQGTTPSTGVHDRHSGSAAPPRLQRAWQLPSVSVGTVLAVAALVFAAVVLTAALAGNSPMLEETPWPGGPGRTSTEPVEIVEPQTLPAPRHQAARQKVVVDTVEELRRALREPNPSVQLRAGKVFDLTRSRGLLVAGQEQVTLESTDPAQPPTLKLSVQIPAENPEHARPDTLTLLKCGQVAFRGLRIEVGQTLANLDFGTTPVGLALLECGRVDFQECRFDVEGGATLADATVVSVQRQAGAGETETYLRHCTFHLRRWNGFDFLGRHRVTCFHCGAAGGRSFLSVGDEAFEASQAAIELRHCTLILENSAAAIEVGPGSKCSATTGYCVFGAPSGPDPSAMMMPEVKTARPVVLRPAGEKPESSFTPLSGEPSAYFRVEPYGATGPLTIEVRTAPWLHNPPTAHLAVSPEPWKAFQLATTQRVLMEGLPRSVGILGVVALPLADAKLYSTWPPARSTNPGMSKIKVWHPLARPEEIDTLPRNFYTKLEVAIAELRPGEELHIRGSGRLPVPSTILNRPNQRILIKAEEGSTPVLVPKPGDRAEVSLFRLEEGELHLEGLEFELRPRAEDALRSVAVVTVAGGRRVEFHQCVFTLEEQKSQKVSVAVIADVSGLMRKPEAMRAPDLYLENTFVRGRGRILYVPTAVPFQFSLVNCLSVLVGPVVDLGAPAKPPASGAAAAVQFSHTTGLLGGPLLEIRPGMAGEVPLALPVELRSESSLWCPLDAEHAAPLICVQPGESAKTDRYFTWQTSGNSFANYPKAHRYVEFLTEPGEVDTSWGEADWLRISREKAASLGKLSFQKAVDAKGTLAASPADFTVIESDLAGSAREHGARISALRKPVDREPGDPRNPEDLSPVTLPHEKPTSPDSP